MAYDKKLAQRVEKLLEGKSGCVGKKMFGGVCFLLNGNMACGVLNEDLIVRVGPQSYEDCLKMPNTKPFDITGRPMKGWVMVAPEGHKTAKDLRSWIERGVTFTRTLPAK